MTKVVGRGDSLGKKKVRDLSLSKDAFSGGSLVFTATFEDRTQAIYLTRITPTIPKYSVNLKRGWNQIGGPVRTVSREDLKTSVRIWPVFYRSENRKFSKSYPRVW